MSKLTSAQRRGVRMHKLLESIRNTNRLPYKAPLLVYEAPAAEAWVLIVEGEAWVADSSAEEFVFWGPLGRKPISFPIPDGWPT